MSDICSRLSNLPTHFEPFVTQFLSVGLSDFARPWLGSCVIIFFSVNSFSSFSKSISVCGSTVKNVRDLRFPLGVRK